MTAASAPKVLGALYVVFALACAMPLIAGGVSSSVVGAVMAGDVVMAVACLLLPWQRWPARSPLLLAVPTVALLAVCVGTGMLPAGTPGLAFALLFVWIGAYFPRWSGLSVLPLALVGYAVAVWEHTNGLPLEPQTLVMVGLVWLLVAEVIAAQHRGLEAAAHELAFLLHNSTDLIVRLDEHSTIRFISPSVTTLLGWQVEEMIGRNSAGFRHPDDQGSVAESLAAPGRPVLSTRRLRHRDGSYRRMETHSRAVPTRKGGYEILSTSRDITERYEAERELERRAHHDTLTGLPNRELLGRRLSELLRAPHDEVGFGALLFLDLDGFKAVNDVYGHQAGDELLRQVAERLSSLIRIGDTLARFGGDEFVLLLTGLPNQSDSLPRVASRVELALTSPYFLAPGTVQVGCSIGVVPLDTRSTALELLARADEAMYAQKREHNRRTTGTGAE